MLSYHELLRQYIDNSELSLSQIESKLREKGLATNKAYISKLQNGKLPPAGDEINKALAEVLNGDEEELILISYAEKAPILKEVIEKLFTSFKIMILNNKELVITMIKSFNPNVDLEQLPDNYDNIIDQEMSNISLKNKIVMISSLTEFLGQEDLGEVAKFQDGMIQINPISLFSDEVTQEKYREAYSHSKMDSLVGLTIDEHLFLTKQLELYRNLGLKSSQQLE